MDKYVSIQLDKNANQPLYQQLADKIKKLILTGELKENDKLPPIRKLATMLGVNNVTIVNAYRWLEQEDLLYTRPGSGTYVGSASRPLLNNNGSFVKPIYHSEYDNPALNDMNKGRIQIPAGAINFASAIPNPELFPVEDFKNILNEVLDRDGGQAFTYQDGQGYYPLRESMTGYLKQKGIELEQKNVQVISGAQQGIDIIAKSLVQPGDYVLMEETTYTGAIAAFRSRGAHIIPVSIDTDGISIKNLEQACNKYHPRLIYVIPNFHTPTGISYSAENRQKLLQLCVKQNIFILEDDSFTELAFDGQERLPLKCDDKYDLVIFIKSFSKILMPGLRLGFLLAPARIMPSLLTAKHSTDISTPGLIQRAFDLYLRQGLWEKHIAYMKEIYRERYYIMLNSMKELLPAEIEFTEPGGGLSFWLKLPPGSSANYFYTRCLEKNIIISPGSLFSAANKRDGEHFRLNFAALYPDQIVKGIKSISECYQQIRSELLNSQNSYSPLL